jgi:hypothetical protein
LARWWSDAPAQVLGRRARDPFREQSRRLRVAALVVLLVGIQEVRRGNVGPDRLEREAVNPCGAAAVDENGESNVTLYLASLQAPVPVLMATMGFSPPMSWTAENPG